VHERSPSPPTSRWARVCKWSAKSRLARRIDAMRRCLGRPEQAAPTSRLKYVASRRVASPRLASPRRSSVYGARVPTRIKSFVPRLLALVELITAPISTCESVILERTRKKACKLKLVTSLSTYLRRIDSFAANPQINRASRPFHPRTCTLVPLYLYLYLYQYWK